MGVECALRILIQDYSKHKGMILMSLLIFNSRPYAVFNPHDKSHRKWFAEFQKNRTWAKCPVRFIVPDDQGDLVTLCQRRLISYYTNKEFG